MSTSSSIHVVYPFAEPPFAAQARPTAPTGATRILYAGRLSPEKGIYTLLAMLHVDVIAEDPTPQLHRDHGRIGQAAGSAHRTTRAAPIRGSASSLRARVPPAMAALMAEHDIVVMPSNGQYWHETFGIVSIEAQHSGCRVVASDDGGLPETNCGAVILVEPDNAEALAWGIREAIDARTGAGGRTKHRGQPLHRRPLGRRAARHPQSLRAPAAARHRTRTRDSHPAAVRPAAGSLAHTPRHRNPHRSLTGPTPSIRRVRARLRAN